MNIQIFGTKKCNDTKKAERFFKERGIKYQFIDMKEKGMSKGEFNSVAQVNGGLDNMINWDGKDKDLPRHQNVGQVWNAEAPIFALQLVQPIVHASCLQKLMFHACLRLLYHDWTGHSRKNRHSGAVCTPAGKDSGRYSKMQPHSGPFHNKKGWCFSIPERTFHFFHWVFH